jgi:uncharacterized protein YllA (UPF0747 family)
MANLWNDFSSLQNFFPKESSERKVFDHAVDAIQGHKELSIPITDALIKKIHHPKVKFVLTGQQPGLAGGNYLVCLKAMAALANAKKLEKQLAEPIIPIFWIASDDSDLKECNIIHYPKVMRLSFNDSSQNLPLGSRYFTNEHQDQLWNFFPNLKKAGAYKAGDDFAVAMAKSLYHHLPNAEEFLFVRGDAKWISKASQPMLKKILTQSKEIEQALLKREKELKIHNLKPGVPHIIGQSRVFKINQGKRERIWQNKISDGDYTHDALSRPLVCDTIFPVLGHVLGPGELKYFAQLAPLYSLFKIPFPRVYKRPKAWVISNEIKVLADSLSLDPKKIVAKSHSELLEELGQRMPTKAEAIICHPSWQVSPHLEKLMRKINTINSSFMQLEQKSWASTEYGLHLKVIYNWFGEGRVQERTRNFAELSANQWIELSKGLDATLGEEQWLYLK